MKRLSLMLLLLAGCVHTRVISFDNTNSTFVVSGNRHASQQSMDNEAKDYCKGAPPVLLGCGQGSRSTGMVGSEVVVLNAKDAKRCQYRCGEGQ